MAVARVVMMFDSFSMGRASGHNSGTVYPSAALLDKPAVARGAKARESQRNAPERKVRSVITPRSLRTSVCPPHLPGRAASSISVA